MQEELTPGEVHLLGKKPCTKANLILDVSGKSDGAFQAHSHGGGFRCSHGDVVGAKHAQDDIVGMFHFALGHGVMWPITCTVYYRMKYANFFINTVHSFGLHLVSQGR